MKTVRIMCCAALAAGVVGGACGGERMPLWPEGRIPDFQKHQFCAMDNEAKEPGFRKEEHARPYLEWFEPPAERNGACMLLLPGGAYIGCGSTNLVDEWKRTLTAAGYQCACLVYRRPRPKDLPFYQSAWEDAQRAVRLIRSEAARRGYDAEKIGAIGMSAGGHLGCLLATSALTPTYEPVDETDKLPCHLNWCVAMAPAYNTVTGNEIGMQSPEDGKSVVAKISPVFKLDEKTCPMSLHHGGTDPWSPNGSSLLYRELHRRGIPAELHIFANRYHGAHGLNRAMEFMRQMNFDGRLAEPAAAYVGRFPSNGTAKVERELLWPEGRTPDRQAEQKYEPFLEWHLPKRFWTKSVLIVLPGGGYAGCGIEGDGIPAANFLNAHHMAAVLVRYRTPRPKGKPKHLLAWQDAQRAIRMVRSEAAARGCDPDHIGLLGFSAGGHLAVLCASSSQTPAYAPVDDIDKLSCRVQWAIPVYPAYALTDIAEDANVRGGCNEGDAPVPEFRFDSDTPPMCFFHGDEDTWSSMGSVRIWEKLRQMGLQADVHTLAKRGHCFMYKCSADTGSYTWLDYAWEFMGRAGCFVK